MHCWTRVAAGDWTMQRADILMVSPDQISDSTFDQVANEGKKQKNTNTAFSHGFSISMSAGEDCTVHLCKVYSLHIPLHEAAMLLHWGPNHHHQCMSPGLQMQIMPHIPSNQQ